MNAPKYLDLRTGRPVDVQRDTCPLSQWEKQYPDYPAARHEAGFPVFLDPERLVLLDEYAVADPYSVERRLDVSFHKNRIDCTIKLLEELPAGDERILDIGCGQGHITSCIAKAFPKADVTGLDASITAVAHAARTYPDIEFIVADAYELPFSKSYFDAVICNNIWEHVPDPLALLAAITRVLRPGGYLLISTPSRYRLGNLFRVALGRPVHLISTHHVTEYSVGQVIEQLAFGKYQLIRILSRRDQRSNLIKRIIAAVAAGLVRGVRSHHCLDATAFYLARNDNGDADTPS